MQFDSSARTPEMRIDVSLGEFHSTHDRAHTAQRKVHNELSTMSTDELTTALAELQEGQRLTDAEDGDDFMYASSYHQEIRMVIETIRKASS
jgi:hypothetical protein